MPVTIQLEPHSTQANGGCWPTPEQEILLRAALIPGEAAIEAWQRWQTQANMECLDLASYRLLPLVYRNLQHAGCDDPLMPQLRAIYLKTRQRNRKLFRNAFDALRLLHQAGIPTMLLKGSSMLLLYYREYGLRSMFDLDFLVPAEQVLSTLQILLNAGWKADALLARQNLDVSLLSMMHSGSFTHPSGFQVDIHWHAQTEWGLPESDDLFWQGAQPFSFNQIPTHVMNPSDQLLIICVHGVRWQRIRHLQWIADAYWLLRKVGDQMDWDRLLEMAERRRMVLSVREALHFLAHHLAIPIPTWVLKRLAEMVVGRPERLEYYFTVNHVEPFGRLPLLWLRQSRQAGNASFLVKTQRFLAAIKHTWYLENTRQLPSAILRKGIEHVRIALNMTK